MFSKIISQGLTFWIKNKKKRKDLRHRIEKALCSVQKANEKEKVQFCKTIQIFKETHADFIQRYRNSYEIVSLGWDCFARTIPTRWGIKTTKAQGCLSCPFDLSMHESNAVFEYIKTHFADYLAGVKYNQEIKHWHNPEMKTIYNHDDDCLNFAAFAERYKNRIENFETIKTSKKAVFYVYHTNNSQILPIIEAFQLIKAERPDKTSKLIIINNFKKQKTKEKDIYILNIPLPARNYIWFEHFETTAGRKFEKKIAEEIIKILKSTLIKN